jgi:hypothetical protein
LPFGGRSRRRNRRGDGPRPSRHPAARDRRADARRRQDRDPQGDPQQAGEAHRRGVRADEEPHDRGPGPARSRRRPPRRGRRDRPLVPRTLGRPRLSGWVARRGDPAGRSHRLLLRCLLGDDDRPPVPWPPRSRTRTRSARCWRATSRAHSTPKPFSAGPPRSAPAVAARRPAARRPRSATASTGPAMRPG